MLRPEVAMPCFVAQDDLPARPVPVGMLGGVGRRAVVVLQAP